MMNKKALICLVLLVFPLYLPAQITVAVTDFTNQSSEFYLDAWQKSVPELLKTELSSSEGMILVERGQIESVLDEQALSMTGLIDSSTAQKVGGLLGAEYVITGTINKNGDWIIINAKILRVVSGKMIGEMVRARDSEYLSEMVTLLSNNILHSLLNERTYRDKIELKKYPTTYFLAGSVLLAGGAIWANNTYQKKLDEYHQTTALSEFDNTYDQANTYYKTRNVLIILSGAALAGTLYCWINNLNPDAVIARDEEEYLGIVPGFYFEENGNWSAYVTIRF
jgi:TolB-like protein